MVRKSNACAVTELTNPERREAETRIAKKWSASRPREKVPRNQKLGYILYCKKVKLYDLRVRRLLA